MSALPYHKRYHSDALAGFMSLTLEERGAYQTLLDMMYDRQGPLLDNERLLAGYMQTSIRKWRQLRLDLIAKGKIFITRDGEISNSRVEKELENAAKTARKLSENGSKGGRKRAENEKKSSEIKDGDEATPPHGHGLNQIPDTRDQKKNPPKPPKPELPADVRAVMEAAGFVSPPPDLALLRAWYDLGATLDLDIVPTVRAVATSVRNRTGRAPFKLQLFDQAIREKLAADEHEIERLKRVHEGIRRQDEKQAAAGGGR